MINAMKEFEEHVGNRTVLCAWVEASHYAALDLPRVTLRSGHSEREYQKFLDNLGFEYDDGFGCQELEGVIWFTDGTWSTRGEYDGSEWWQNHTRPEIPEALQ